MSPRTSNTKEAIRDAALTLFAEKGYDGVGMREIAASVGVREGAIYRHYAGKQAIFDAILEGVGTRYEVWLDGFTLPDAFAGLQTGIEPYDALTAMCARMFCFYLLDDEGVKIRRLTVAEQFRSTSAGKFFRNTIIEQGLEIVIGVMQGLIAAGHCILAEPSTMAVQYYSPLYYLLSRHDAQPDAETAGPAALAAHFRQFAQLYRIERSRP